MTRVGLSLTWFFLYLFSTLALAGPKFGPKMESEETPPPQAQAPATAQPSKYAYNGPRLDIAIPVFDPGIPADPAKWEQEGIWPQLRRAEAVRVAVEIKKAIEELDFAGVVSVVPDFSASADLYVSGQILASNGEDFGLSIELYDAMGIAWIKKTKIKHRVPEGWHTDPSRVSVDPFTTVYQQAAVRIAEAVVKQGKKHEQIAARNAKLLSKNKDAKVKLSDLEKVIKVKELLFARSISPDLYADTVVSKGDKVKLSYLPATDDSNWVRVTAVRAADSRFGELSMQNYVALTEGMKEPYATWQRDAYPIAHDYRKKKEAANTALILGVLGAVAGAAAAANGGNSNAAQAAGAAVAAVSAAAIVNSFKLRDESKQQAAMLDELGNSVDGVIAPRVIEMSGKQVALSGTAAEQYTQWRKILKDIYTDTAIDPGAIDFNESEKPDTKT